MIWINMFFNVLLSTSALIGYFSKFPLIYTKFIKYASVCYFVEDSLMEIGLYKRYIYLPHHIIALIAIGSVWKNCPIYDSLLMFFFAESSAFITNIRGVLKKHGTLSIKYDKVFFMYYICARNIAMPIIIYRCSDYTIIYYSGCLVQLMNLYWTYMWGKSIIKYQNKSYITNI